MACVLAYWACERLEALGLWGEVGGSPRTRGESALFRGGDALRFGLIGQQCELEGHLSPRWVLMREAENNPKVLRNHEVERVKRAGVPRQAWALGLHTL